LSCAEENEDSIVGSVSVDINSPNTVSFCGVSWNQYTAKYTNKIKIYGTDFSLLKVNRKIIASDLLPGRGTLFPMSSFSRYGLFDNFNFPHYAADEDFTLHLKRNGYSLLICVNAVVLSHINDTGIKKSKSNLERLTSIRSPTNIRIRYLWAKKNAPLPYLYFVCELSRILYSIYIKSYIKSN
jgi:GT2 family glycosyltransferase